MNTAPVIPRKKRRPLSSAPFRQSLHDSLTDQLRDMILKHELEPGEWIQEMELCATMGVSRTPMREALKVLAFEKLVILHPYRGASVAEIDPLVVAELFEVQAIIESQAGILACERASDDEIAEFAAAQALMVEHFDKGDRASYFILNQKLHTLIVRMSRNGCLLESHASVMKQIARARYKALDDEHRWVQSIAQHGAICDALVGRRGAELADLIRTHVADTSVAVLRGLKPVAAQKAAVN